METAVKMPDRPVFLLTVDVEDWFQVENFKPWISFESWDQRRYVWLTTPSGFLVFWIQ